MKNLEFSEKHFVLLVWAIVLLVYILGKVL
jgi:hypothetical protein